MAKLGGPLVLATAGIVGSVAVVGVGPAAAAGTITQKAPVKGSVAYGTPCSDQLQTSGNIGPVTFVTDSATTWGTVSSTGAVSCPGTALPGTYLLFGTDADAFGDTGQWQYTLTVINGPPISQTAPTTGAVHDDRIGCLYRSSRHHGQHRQTQICQDRWWNGPQGLVRRQDHHDRHVGKGHLQGHRDRG